MVRIATIRDPAQPIADERRPVAQFCPKQPEIVKVGVAKPTPVDELDAELEGGIRLPDELILVNLKLIVEQANWGNRSLADADRSDLLRFDERDGVRLRSDNLGQESGRHPAGRSATYDDDVANPAFRHSHLPAARQ